MRLTYYLKQGVKIPKSPGIYQFINLENGKSYIGQSQNLWRRLTDTVGQLNRGIYHNVIFQKAWKKYNKEKGFVLIILSLCKNLEELNQKESYYIQKYNSLHIANGYNIELGGKEVSKRLYQSRQNKESLIDRKRPVAAYDLDGCFIKDFPTLTKCAQFYKLTVSAIYSSCIGEIGRVGNYIFRYIHNNYVQKHIPPISWNKRNIEVLLYDRLTGQFVKYIESANQAIKELGCTSTALSFCLDGINPTLKGFILKRKWSNEFSKQIQPHITQFSSELRPCRGEVIATSINNSEEVLHFLHAFDASKQIQELKNFKSKGTYQIIKRALEGQSKSAYGYFWKYVDVQKDQGYFFSTKFFDGFSASFRQYAATHSHCQLLHSYPLCFKVTFQGKLDHRNWVADYGSFKSNGIKDILKYWFDHTTLVAEDDPQLDFFIEGHYKRLLDLRILPAGGCERYAELVYKIINVVVLRETEGRVSVKSVECFEHENNSAIYTE